MLHQIGNVFKKNDFGTFGVNDSRDLKKQIAALIVEAFLLSGDRKRLTRKTCGQYIKIRD